MKLRFSFTSIDAATALKLVLPLLCLLFGLATQQFGLQITQMELIFTSARFRGAFYGLQAITAALGFLALYAWLGGAPRLLGWLSRLQAWLQRPPGPWLAARALMIFALTYPIVLFGFYGNFLVQLFPRLLSFVILLLLGAGLLAVWRGGNWLRQLPLAAVYLAAWYCAATFLNLVNAYPFSLEWSEVSRFYQASFYFSEQVYGVQLALPITHPTRYLLQSLPFLWAESPLWLHRLWQALLWSAMPLFTGYLLARRLTLGKWRWPFIAFSFLYLMQGAVFYHLLPAIFIVLWGFDAKRPWRSLVFTVAASMWAGLSRINWLPVPGALAALLYLLEVAWPARQQVWRYLRQPVLLGAVGLAAAAAAYAIYIASSGVADPGQFGSAFTSDLLWQRLWPMQEFPLGVLPGILLVSLPLVLVILMRLRQSHTALGPLRAAIIFIILAVLFAGGLVVSVKIGGGTNLHNMDAYLALLWVLAAYMLAGDYAPQKGKPADLRLPAWLLALLVSIPVLFAVYSGGPLNLPRDEVAEATLTEIQQLVAEHTARGEEVLFISQRHLLTYHMVDAPLVHEYEKLFLMEMAISNNQPYLLRFWDNLEEHRFALIITDPLHDYIYTESQDDLAAENNAWVQHVSVPVLCAYDTLRLYPELGIEILQPRIPKCDS